MTARAPILVLGIGNELLSDEGLGVVAARRVADRAIPGVDVLEGATLGLSLLPEIVDRRAVLVLDAIVMDGRKPGDVVLLEGDEVPQAGGLLMSAHEIGVPDALAAATFAGRAPDRVAALGMVPSSLADGVGLSAEIAWRLDALIDRAEALLASWIVLHSRKEKPCTKQA